MLSPVCYWGMSVFVWIPVQARVYGPFLELEKIHRLENWSAYPWKQANIPIISALITLEIRKIFWTFTQTVNFKTVYWTILHGTMFEPRGISPQYHGKSLQHGNTVDFWICSEWILKG